MHYFSQDNGYASQAIPDISLSSRHVHGMENDRNHQGKHFSIKVRVASILSLFFKKKSYHCEPLLHNDLLIGPHWTSVHQTGCCGRPHYP